MRVRFRLLSSLLICGSLGAIAGCQDSGRSPGGSRLVDGGAAGGSVQSGGTVGTGGASGTAQTGGATTLGGSTGNGGAAGGSAGGRGGATISSDAGTTAGDVASGACGNRGESCANQPCCRPLICLTSSSVPTCYESYPPPADGGSTANEAGISGDTKPPRDGGVDVSVTCALPEGCADAAGVLDAPADRPALANCAALVCATDEEVVNVASPALGTRQCACMPIPDGGLCADCACGASLCAQLNARCAGFSLETGLLCAENG